jgi:peptidyl-prolyl cis-trans isomerase C
LQSTNAGPVVADDLGDDFMLRMQFQQESTDDIARELGKKFAGKIATQTPGSWQGPVRSGYGMHLVFVYEREAAAPYPFAEIRDRIKNDYLFELRNKRNEEVLKKLKSRYQIIVEGS